MKSTPRNPNVRISQSAHQLLRQIAKEEQRWMQSGQEWALELYRREMFLRAANADFASPFFVIPDWLRSAPLGTASSYGRVSAIVAGSKLNPFFAWCRAIK